MFLSMLEEGLELLRDATGFIVTVVAVVEVGGRRGRWQGVATRSNLSRTREPVRISSRRYRSDSWPTVGAAPRDEQPPRHGERKEREEGEKKKEKERKKGKKE